MFRNIKNFIFLFSVFFTLGANITNSSEHNERKPHFVIKTGWFITINAIDAFISVGSPRVVIVFCVLVYNVIVVASYEI